MFVCSYRLASGPGHDGALRAALAALAQDLASRPGCIATSLLRYQGQPCVYRFEETWQSAEAHQASMDPALKALLKQVVANVTEPVETVRLEPA